MATAVCRREQQGLWQSIFPADQHTEQTSAFFVKKLLAVSVSYLTYLRTIFPESAYGNRQLEDMNLKILQDSSSSPGANQVCQWVRNCFDALDKHYLDMLVLGLYVDAADPNTLLESYSFKFNYEEGMDVYHNDKKVISGTSLTETKKSTTTMLRTILVLTQGLRPLPEDIMLTMKLYFNKDITPEDYHPKGFVETSPDAFVYDDDSVNIKVGDVSTKFHTVKMRIRTKCHNFDLDPGTKEVVAEISPESSASPAAESVNPETAQTSAVTTPEPESYDVKCVCGNDQEDGILIQCSKCSKWSHAVCYKIIHDDQIPEDHVCTECPGSCTDPSLSCQDAASAQATALWRRSLIAVTEVKRMLPRNFAKRLGIDMAVARKLMDRMVSEGYLAVPTKGKKTAGYIVNVKEIEGKGKDTYFNNMTDSLTQHTMDGVEEVTETLSVLGKRQRSEINNESFEIASSQGEPAKRKRQRVSAIRTPVQL